MYEKLLDHAYRNQVSVYEKSMKKRNKGLYGESIIWLNKDYLITPAEKASILAEELGHHHTTFGDIRDQTKISNRKQELRARIWAYEKSVPLYKIVEAHRLHLRNKCEFADYLNITESFLEAALKRYRDKHGQTVEYENYTISFEPLGVVEWFEHKNF